MKKIAFSISAIVLSALFLIKPDLLTSALQSDNTCVTSLKGDVACGGEAGKCITHSLSQKLACSIDNYWFNYMTVILPQDERYKK